MRNSRGAFWALGLAGAAYLWKNRNKLQQQFGNMQRPSNNQLPNYGSNQGSQTSDRSQNSSNQELDNRNVGGSFRGSDV